MSIKNRFHTFLTVSICLLAATSVASAQYSGGTGEPNDPYQIATAEDLIALGETPDDYNKHFILTADIDLDPNLPGRKVFDRAVIAPDANDASWQFEGTPFTGIFDGNGHTISHLAITGERNLGLFGQLDSGAVISNLGLESVDVDGIYCVGGLLGSNHGSVNASYTTGSVAGHGCVGGLVGDNDEDGNITWSYSTGVVSGNWAVGGFVGTNSGSIATSHSSGTVAGGDGDIGGFVGTNSGSIITSHSTGTVIGEDGDMGGLVGANPGVIGASYSTGSVSGGYWEGRVGGLVGVNWGGIVMSYSTGSVTGFDGWFGGLVGGNRRWGLVERSMYPEDGYCTGCFWDVQTSGQATSDGGTGLSTAEMQDIGTFLTEGWDFVGEVLHGTCDYWQMSPGNYPQLLYHIGNSPVMPEGLGTVEDPYMIRDARDLGTIGFRPMSHYRLEASIDLSGITWSMAVIPWFAGTLDGNGHVVSNLHVQGGTTLGLVGKLCSGARISNLGVEAANVRGISAVGALVAVNEGNIYTSYSTGVVTGDNHAIGGLVGSNNHSRCSISASYSNCKVVGGDKYTGGLVGVNSGLIDASYSTGSVRGDRFYVGGLVGYNAGRGSVTDSYSTSTVSGLYSVGVLVGANYGGNVNMSFTTGAVTGESDVGGLVGDNTGVIGVSYSTSTVNGESSVGGLVGSTSRGSSTIVHCYSTGSVAGSGSVGGLVGHSSLGDIAMSYSTGTVSYTGTGSGEQSGVGGLVGYSGGRGGNIPKHSTVRTCFWDTETSGLTAMCGSQDDYATGCDDSFGKTTAEMQTASTFLEAGWDFIDETANGLNELWQMSEESGYPVLAIFNRYDPPQLQGQGTPGSPYLITDALDLGAMVHYSLSAHYRLAASIDLSDIRWSTAVLPWFAGTFDGNGHTISYLTITGGRKLGLFGELASGAEVRNLGVVDINITGSGDHIGGLVGSNEGAVINCHSTGAISSNDDVGGLVGHNQGSIVESYSTGSVSGSSGIGGLAGNNYGSIASSYTTGAVTGDEKVGGLAGDNYGSIASSYSTGAITGDEEVGGLAGNNDGSIVSSYSTGTVSGNVNVGGLVGSSSGTIANCYAVASVSGHTNVAGGLIGLNDGALTDCYARSEVVGGERVGGLVGMNESVITRCYCTGSSAGDRSVGGLVGSNLISAASQITVCFWDAQDSGLPNMCGIGNCDDAGGKATAEMQTPSTYLEVGWDFIDETNNGTEDIWWILEGQDYPRLWWELIDEAPEP